MRRNLPVRLIAAWGALALSLGVAGLAAPGAAQAAAPALTWGPCQEEDPEGLPERLVCATLSVPVDWSKPKGQKFDLALAKLPAAVPGQRIGSLFVNPGGPGGSGVGMVYGAEETFSAELINRFDIVSFDPRGLAGSTALRCYDTAEQARADRAPFLYPETPAEENVWRQADDKLSAACARRGGPVLGHMSSADVARDLDRLRIRLGDRKLTYLGYSYGSLLGQTYANLFPRTSAPW